MIDEERMALVRERYDLSRERIKEIQGCGVMDDTYDDFFMRCAQLISYVEDVHEKRQDGSFYELNMSDLEDINYMLYRDVLPGYSQDKVEDAFDESILYNMASYVFAGSANAHYDTSYSNPFYARRRLGAYYAQVLSFLATEIRAIIPLAYQNRLEEMTAINELFIDIFNRFEDGTPDVESIRDVIYWYISDYCDLTVTSRIRSLLDPSMTFYKDIIMKSDLKDLRYLYHYGEYISVNERKMAAYLNSLPSEEIDAMAATLVEGYIRGFEVMRIDRTGKKTVQLLGNAGFERVLRSVIRQFEAYGLETIIYREPIHAINKMGSRNGFQSTSVNPQYEFDHKNDRGLFFDKRMMNRYLDMHKLAYETYKEKAALLSGPAVIEVFGDALFEPEVKEEAIKMDERQQQLFVKMIKKSSDIRHRYIEPTSTSFAVIAWPVPSIGSQFEAIMQETIKVNNLDNDTYRQIQKAMIDAMDGCHHMHIEGCNGNETMLDVCIRQLSDPEKETAFENCTADVNIPVGEVFTSPVLEGTNGMLHVSCVYLEGLSYVDLKLTFSDGFVSDYSCRNFEDDKLNKTYIKENLMENRPALPMGEFAIGTNTMAYAMYRRYGIGQIMPILIMEKTGPHFAIGDTCYSHCEDHRVYNFDGKEIMARDNSASAKRKDNPDEAYFNVHTDITIPYNEIGVIKAVFADGREVAIIENGRFVLPGTEVLNEALDTL